MKQNLTLLIVSSITVTNLAISKTPSPKANPQKTVNTDIEEEPRLKRKPTTSSARPRRMSEVDIHDNKKPIPDATSLFIFSKTNRLGAGERRRLMLQNY